MILVLLYASRLPGPPMERLVGCINLTRFQVHTWNDQDVQRRVLVNCICRFHICQWPAGRIDNMSGNWIQGFRNDRKRHVGGTECDDIENFQRSIGIQSNIFRKRKDAKFEWFGWCRMGAIGRAEAGNDRSNEKTAEHFHDP